MRDRVTYTGIELDEIVVRDCSIHLEQMDDGWYWVGVYVGEKRLTFRIEGTVTIEENELGIAPEVSPALTAEALLKREER